MLDAYQETVYKKFPSASWLSNKNNYERIIDWITFYRRNIPVFIEHYLKIQQYRFEERIQYHVHVQEGLEKLCILPLILQPIVENSIIHGLESKEGIGTIDINIYSKSDKTVICISDDGMGMNKEKLNELHRKLNCYNEKGRHIGVSNVHQRVKLKYGDSFGVTIDSVEGSYTKVEILLPRAAALKTL